MNWLEQVDRWSSVAARMIAIGGFVVVVVTAATSLAQNWAADMVLESQAFQEFTATVGSADTQNSVPTGAVVAFDLPDGCPDGWSDFGDGAGRVVIGTGSRYPYRSSAGEAQVTLGIEHLPTHRHTVEEFEWGFDVDSDGDDRRIDVDNGRPRGIETGSLTTSSVGDGEAHENLPPYIVLHFCHKD